MISEYLTCSHWEGIEIPLRPFLFLIHVTLGSRLDAFHNANNWLRPLLWQCVLNINTQRYHLFPDLLLLPPHSLAVSSIFTNRFLILGVLLCLLTTSDHPFNDLWTVI